MVKKKEEEDYSGTGYEDGQYPICSLRGFSNDKITHFRLLVR